MKINPDVLIIGAGISGITCAAKCQEKNLDFILIEKDKRPGGRLGSIYEDGYTFDIGFQVFNSSYNITKSLLNLNQIKLQYFKPGALIHNDNHFEIISDPIRDIGQTFNTLFSSIPTLKDKLKILKLKFSLLNYSIEKDRSEDTETRIYLQKFGFSENMINSFFSPFFAGVFLERKLNTSSKFFKYVFSKLSKGYASLPLNGMQEIPNNILRNIDKNKIFFDSDVEEVCTNKQVKLSSGQILKPSRIILTGASQNLINKVNVKKNSVKTLYFKTDSKPNCSKYIHIFPDEKYINNIAFLTSISDQYSVNNDILLSVSIIKTDLSQTKLISHVLDRLKNIYGGNFVLLKYFDIQQATIYQPKNYFNKKSTHKLQDDIYFCGDNMVHGSIEGAVISGIKVSDMLCEDFI